MTTSDLNAPRGRAFEPPPAAITKSPIAAKMTLSPGEVTSFLVQITRGIWRLESAVERSRARGEPISQEIQVMIEHLHEDLESLGLQVNDPAGKTYEPGMKVKIAHLEPGGSGSLVIKQTVQAGVSLAGQMLKPASVILGREKTS